MSNLSRGAHVLVFPYPAQGHMKPLLDLTHQLATRGLCITIIVSPQNLPLLSPLLSKHSTIQNLVLPFPTHPSFSAAIENAKGLPPNAVRDMIHSMGELYNPILHWFQKHPSPPIAIISDKFLGWTHHLACQLGIRRLVFSPVGAMAVSVVYSQWRDQPKRDDTNGQNVLISFSKIPNCPIYPWWQLSPFYRSYVEGDPVSEFLKDGIHADTVSWGLVINTFNDLEKVYLDYLKEELGHDRVWAVGPILPSADDHMSRPIERGGSSSDLGSNILSWLDKCDDHKVVYVCFGSKAVLTNKQMEELALGLEKSGAKFIWCVKEQNKGHVDEEYGVIPIGFEDRVVGRGLVIKEWVPQTLILKHRAVGAFLTHCGWNSVLEGLIAGVPMLTWPMGAEQFINATLLVDELKEAIRVCEGAQAIPSSTDIARMVAKSVCENSVERVRTMELHEAALGAIKKGGTSFKDLHELVKCLFNEASQAKLCDVQE